MCPHDEFVAALAGIDRCRYGHAVRAYATACTRVAPMLTSGIVDAPAGLDLLIEVAEEVGIDADRALAIYRRAEVTHLASSRIAA